MQQSKPELKTQIENLIYGIECPAIAAAAICELISLEFHNPERAVAIVWDIDDMRAIRPDLSQDQAMQVLRQAHRRHKGNLGLNRAILKAWAAHLFPLTNAR